jgi:hypothetical protein
VLERYAVEHKRPLELGSVSEGCEVIEGEFWSGNFARHDRRRLAYAVGLALGRLLFREKRTVRPGQA